MKISYLLTQNARFELENYQSNNEGKINIYGVSKNWTVYMEIPYFIKVFYHPLYTPLKGYFNFLVRCLTSWVGTRFIFAAGVPGLG